MHGLSYKHYASNFCVIFYYSFVCLVNESYGGNNDILKINKLKFLYAVKRNRLGMVMNHIQKLLSEYLHIASTGAVTVHVHNITSIWSLIPLLGLKIIHFLDRTDLFEIINLV